MVFFTCEGCNETLKKAKVEQHSYSCKKCWAVSCIDCSQIFQGNDYAAHTSCISEAGKYLSSVLGDTNP
jgi:cell growth-regulating nucleolar protein